jgi:hypothetical protein
MLNGGYMNQQAKGSETSADKRLKPCARGNDECPEDCCTKKPRGGNRRHAGGLASAMSNLKAIDRRIYLLNAGSDAFTLIYKALVEYRRLSGMALGAEEQAGADAWLLAELRANRGSLDVLLEELP